MMIANIRVFYSGLNVLDITVPLFPKNHTALDPISTGDYHIIKLISVEITSAVYRDEARSSFMQALVITRFTIHHAVALLISQNGLLTLTGFDYNRVDLLITWYIGLAGILYEYSNKPH